MYYFRGTTLQTDDIPIIQYLSVNTAGELIERVDIFHDGRCRFWGDGDAPPQDETAALSEVASNWSYGNASPCSQKEFEAMKQLALAMAERVFDDMPLAGETKAKGLF